MFHELSRATNRAIVSAGIKAIREGADRKWWLETIKMARASHTITTGAMRNVAKLSAYYKTV